MQRFAFSFLKIAVVSYIGLCATLFFYQRKLLYAPQPRADESAPTLALATDAGSTLVSTREIKGDKALLYFGGNAEDASSYMREFSASHPNHAIYLMHYRGFGGSSGTPSEVGLFKDALALFDAAYAQHKEVVVIGVSLGSGIAAYLARHRPVARLILATPYDSILNIGAGKFPWAPVRWLLHDKYESWRYAPQISAPTLLIAAANDNLIPLKHTQALHGAFAKGVATLKIIANEDHNSIGGNAEYLALIGQFQ